MENKEYGVQFPCGEKHQVNPYGAGNEYDCDQCGAHDCHGMMLVDGVSYCHACFKTAFGELLTLD